MENDPKKDIHNLEDTSTLLVLPDGEEVFVSDSELTPRGMERQKEDKKFTPVIIKRIDEAVRHPDDVLERAIEEGVEQHDRTVASLLLSSTAAGMILGFAAMAVALGQQLIPQGVSPLTGRFITSLFYPLGFIICIMSGTLLFTEQTATAIYPVLDKKIPLFSLFKVWPAILLGNLVGTYVGALLITTAEPIIGAGPGFSEIAHHFFDHSTTELLLSGTLAGWLMAQGGWLTLATPPASSQLMCIYIVTFLIGFAGLHHSIVGSAEVFAYWFTDDYPRYGDSVKFLLTVIVGNLIGGSLFVGVLNYGHIRKTV